MVENNRWKATDLSRHYQRVTLLLEGGVQQNILVSDRWIIIFQLPTHNTWFLSDIWGSPYRSGVEDRDLHTMGICAFKSSEGRSLVCDQ